ncbi:hypothetical protein [uncultured Marinococcus sp.]|nr:hypothetical protein [uncultured Marinococcus sp.]
MIKEAGGNGSKHLFCLANSSFYAPLRWPFPGILYLHKKCRAWAQHF